MKPSAIFVDTWGWMALGHRQEVRHQQVSRLYQELRGARTPVYTSDYILDELITLLFRRETYSEAVRFVDAVLGAASLGHVTIERVTPDRFSTTWTLRKRFQDKPRISFTDLSTMVIMQELGIQQVLTEDEHFTHVGLGFVLVP